MRPAVLGFALLLAAGPAWARPDDKPDAKGSSPSDEVQKLIDDFETSQQDWRDKIRKNMEERNKILADQPRFGPVAERLLELAEKNPKDKRVSPKALLLIVSRASYLPDLREAKDKALGILARDYAGDEQIGGSLSPLAFEPPSDAAEKLLRAVQDGNGSPALKGKAALALGRYWKNTATLVRELKQDPDTVKRIAQALGQDKADQLAKADAGQLEADAEKQLEMTANKYADVVVDQTTVGESARVELFELRNLAIGKVAPEIEGDDLDGKSFKLSDYRGKVVVIDFWGNW